VQREGSVRTQPVESDSIANLSPVAKRHITQDAHLMSDQHLSYRRIAKDYAAHSTVNHLRKEYARGDVHTNTAESFSSILERTKIGVFHYMSRNHLSRYLNEIGFRWNHRIPEQRITRKGLKKTIMRRMPFMSMLVSLLSQCVGKQIRRTKNFSIKSLTITGTPNSQPCFCL
jgi:hypothetical protein